MKQRQPRPEENPRESKWKETWGTGQHQGTEEGPSRQGKGGAEPSTTPPPKIARTYIPRPTQKKGPNPNKCENL